MSAAIRQAVPVTASDDVTLTVGSVQVAGWQSILITRSLESVPASFDIGLTERYPTTPDIWVRPGDPCTVRIGKDLVITGYVDRYEATLDASSHTVRVQGRSKSEDLVDCSALFGDLSGAGTVDHPSMQVLSGTPLAIAQKLAAPYQVTIDSIAGDGPQLPQFVINLGETPWEIIDRITRWSKMLAYDMPNGSVRLANVSDPKGGGSMQSMASGFVMGENVETATCLYTMDGRFSEYEGHFLSTFIYSTDVGVNTPDTGKIVTDSGVPRFRKRYVISEQTQMGDFLAYDRAVWECNRNAGRSQTAVVTCDSWRDSAGTLWEPNSLAPVMLPQLKTPQGANWLIASVVYRRDEGGQHADVTLMPPTAFYPEPVALQPLPPTMDMIDRNNPTKPA